jgi:hypothetical protein
MPDTQFDVRHSVSVAASPAEALRAVSLVAEDWGGEWHASISGGHLEIPVSAGLRYGRLTGRISVQAAAGGGAEVVFHPEKAEYRLWTRAVVILGLSGFGALVTVLWPFYPRLLGLAPVGALLGLSAWFLIVSQLRNEGADEFLGLVAALAEAPEDLLEGPPEGSSEPGAEPDADGEIAAG